MLVGTLPKFLDKSGSITSNRFMLNIVKGHHLQLRFFLPLFCYIKWLSINAAAAESLIIQKEVDELLSKGAIEPSPGGAGFYFNVFVVPKCTGGLWPILDCKQVNCYMHFQLLRCLL